jgi:hypothetical protein
MTDALTAAAVIATNLVRDFTTGVPFEVFRGFGATGRAADALNARKGAFPLFPFGIKSV